MSSRSTPRLQEKCSFTHLSIPLGRGRQEINSSNQIEIDTGVAGSVKVGSGRRMSLDGDVHIWDSTALPELSQNKILVPCSHVGQGKRKLTYFMGVGISLKLFQPVNYPVKQILILDWIQASSCSYIDVNFFSECNILNMIRLQQLKVIPGVTTGFSSTRSRDSPLGTQRVVFLRSFFGQGHVLSYFSLLTM